jgi:hypothetical protein
VDTSTHHLSTFGHHVTIGTGFPIYEGGEEGLLPSANILCFHRSTLASAIQTTSTKVSSDLIPAAPLWLRDKLIPFQGTAQDFSLVLTSVSSLDFLKEELLRPQGPSVWTVSRSIYVVCCERKIWVPLCGCPSVEYKRYLRGKVLHVLKHLPLCDLCTVNDLGTESVAVWDVLLGKCWPAKFEEMAKGATIDQMEGQNKSII